MNEPEILKFVSNEIEYTHDILEDIYLKILEAVPEAILVINENFNVVIFNEKAELLFGYSRVEIIGGSLTKLLSFGFRKQYVSILKNYITSEYLADSYAHIEYITGLTRYDREIKLRVKLNPFIVAGAGLHILFLIQRI